MIVLLTNKARTKCRS